MPTTLDKILKDKDIVYAQHKLDLSQYEYLSVKNAKLNLTNSEIRQITNSAQLWVQNLEMNCYVGRIKVIVYENRKHYFLLIDNDKDRFYLGTHIGRQIYERLKGLALYYLLAS